MECTQSPSEGSEVFTEEGTGRLSEPEVVYDTQEMTVSAHNRPVAQDLCKFKPDKIPV